MPYSAEISRAHPSCFFLVLDQSGSMEDPFAGSDTGRSKAQEVSDVINRLLQTLVMRCAKGEEVRDYFEVGVLGYGQSIAPALQGALAGRATVRLSDLAFNPLIVEQRMKRVPDGAGGLVEHSFLFPVWIEPVHLGGTPMCAALEQAKKVVEDWVSAHPVSYPPTVIHVTDGESTDGPPAEIAARIQALSTDDGPVAFFNLHLSSSPAKALTFPESDTALPDDFARTLFAMSSLLPARLRAEAASEGYRVTDAARGFAFNADLVETIRFIDIGTRVSNVR